MAAQQPGGDAPPQVPASSEAIGPQNPFVPDGLSGFVPAVSNPHFCVVSEALQGARCGQTEPPLPPALDRHIPPFIRLEFVREYVHSCDSPLVLGAAEQARM